LRLILYGNIFYLVGNFNIYGDYSVYFEIVLTDFSGRLFEEAIDSANLVAILNFYTYL